jgi:hypothetical protein
MGRFKCSKKAKDCGIKKLPRVGLDDYDRPRLAGIPLVPKQVPGTGTRIDKNNSFRYCIDIMVEAMVFPAGVQKNAEESLAVKA